MRTAWFAVLIAALTASAACGSGGEAPPGGAAGSAATVPAADPVRAYADAASKLEAASAPLDPALIADMLRTLAGALGGVGATTPDVTIDLRAAAELVLLNPDDPGIAATVRMALIGAAEALAARGASDPALRKAAEDIRPDTPLTQQPEAIRMFSTLASGAFQSLAAR